MTFLPIVGRELRVAARRRSTYWLRAGVALGVLLAAAWIFLMSFSSSQREIGQIIFYFLTGASLLYCLLAGLRATADCLSEEKREGTLGLLFLTDLKGYDVVAGKLAAHSLNALYGVLAVVPLLGLPLLMGGVTVGEFGRVAAVLVNTLFFSLCVGMFASSASRSARKSIAATLLIVLLFTAGIPALGAWLAWLGKATKVLPPFLISSAVFTYSAALDRAFAATPQAFFWSLGTIHGLGWAFLALASVIVPHAWQDRPAGAATVRWRERWQTWSHGDAAERRSFRARLLDMNPYYWLASRPRWKPAWVWGALGLVGCVWAWGVVKYRDDWLNEGVYVATAIFLNSLFKGWIASESGRQLTEDRRVGALELVLSTPLAVPEILRGQRLALQRHFLAPVAFVLCAEVVMLIAGARSSVLGGELRFWVWLWIAGMVMLVADLAALYWVGMWMGLAAHNPKRAFSGAVTRILVLPWIGFALFVMLLALAPREVERQLNWGFFLGAWFVLGLATDMGFGWWARQKLLGDFRVVAAQRYQPRLPWWKKLLGQTAPGDGGS